MNSRRKARELILKALYAYEVGEQAPDVEFESLIERSKFDDSTREFARNLFGQILSHSSESDNHIASLAKNWKFERIAAIDKNILRLSMTELAHFPDIPVRVSINEAVELAKRYGGKESSGFINGILDAYAKTLD
jgi:transcription antitermination protein NusB